MAVGAATAVITDAGGSVVEIIRYIPDPSGRQTEFTSYRQELSGFIADLRSNGNLVYHYTTLQGFLGILKTRSIWASDVRMMNDPSELLYARTILRNLAIKSGIRIDSPQVARIFEGARDWYFAASFSLASDQLSQWRAYGSDVAISIGFDRRFIAAAANGMKGKTEDVLYPVGDSAPRLNAHLSWLTQALGMLNQITDINEMERTSWGINRRLSEMALYIKHPSYAEEKEVRVLISRDELKDIEFRATEDKLLPYLQMPLNHSDVDSRGRFVNSLGMVEIVVWPNGVQNQLMDAIEMAVGKIGVAIIRRSAAPYRL